MKRLSLSGASVLAALLLACSPVCRAQDAAPPTQPAYLSDPAFQAALEQARQSDEPVQGRFSHWQQASEAANGQCVQCLHQVVTGEFAAKKWKDAVVTSRQLEAVATDKAEKFFAESMEGKALLHDDVGGEHPPAAQLEEAERLVRLSLTQIQSPTMVAVDGEVLASLGKYEQAKAQFDLFLSLVKSNDPRYVRLSEYAANPELGALYKPGTPSALQTQGPTASTKAITGMVGQNMSQPAGPEPAYKSDPKFEKAFLAAQERVPPDEKLARWKKANKLANNQCVECLRAIIPLQLNVMQWKDAVGSCNALEAASTEKKDKFYAAAERGDALLHSDNGSLKPQQVSDAEASLRAALAISPRTKALVFKEGRALAMMGRDAEAKAMFERYLELAGEADKYRVRAEHFVDNPHLASLPMAPPFTLTTEEGEQISLDEQVGKVVLLDFWATWCGPCKQTLPEIHSIAKKFAGQPLVVVSISSDANDVAWKEFIAKNDMFWAQYRDANHALSAAYGVSEIPRFFTIDSDGVLQSVKVGSDANIEGDLKKLIKRASEAEKKKALTTDKSADE